MSCRTLTSSAVKAWTGLTAGQLTALTAKVWAVRPDHAIGRPWSLPFPDRILCTVLHLRTNLTERQLADLFNLSTGATHRVLATYQPAIAQLLGPPPTDRRELWVIDGTLIPVRQRNRTANSKNYRKSVCVQVVARRRDRRIVAIGDAWPGNRNDIVAYRATMAAQVAGHLRLIGDGGYQSAAGVTGPTRGPDGRIIKDAAWRRFRKRQATAEHVLAELKVWAILRDCRRRNDSIDHITRAVGAIHNHRIDTPARLKPDATDHRRTSRTRTGF